MIADKTSITLLAEYSDFANVFFKKSAIVLPEYTEMNIYAIDLEKNKQLPYELIYSLGLVELEILKTYIEINLANNFIYSSKSFTGSSILFDKKLNASFSLYINYRSLNNITIKNWYLLPLVGKSFNYLGCAK